MMHKIAIISLGLILMLGVSAITQDQPEIGTELGMKAPDFHLPLVGSDPLEKVNLYDYVGNYDVVMLYFFSAAS